MLVVLDRFTKYTIFIAAPPTCTSEKSAELFLRHVVKFFGVPTNIISDLDAPFTGRFWTALFGLLSSELKLSTANHPQTDG